MSTGYDEGAELELSPQREARLMAFLDRELAARRRRRRIARGAVGLGGVAVVLGSVAAWVVLAPQEVQDAHAWCYSEASAASNGVEMQLERDSPGAVTVADADLAVGACRNLWSTGDVQEPGQDLPLSSAGSYPVPDLLACLRSNLTIVVIPLGAGEDESLVCEGAGFVSAPRSPETGG